MKVHLTYSCPSCRHLNSYFFEVSDPSAITQQIDTVKSTFNKRACTNCKKIPITSYIFGTNFGHDAKSEPTVVVTTSKSSDKPKDESSVADKPTSEPTPKPTPKISAKDIFSKKVEQPEIQVTKATDTDANTD